MLLFKVLSSPAAQDAAPGCLWPRRRCSSKIAAWKMGCEKTPEGGSQEEIVHPTLCRPQQPCSMHSSSHGSSTLRVCTGVHRSEKYFNRLALACGRAKSPPFGDGYTPFNYTSRDGDCQREGILRGARSFRPPRRRFSAVFGRF